MNSKMRRHIGWIFIFFCFVCVHEMQAQRMYDPKFYIGVKAGASLSRMSFSPSVKQGYAPGVLGGVVVRYTEEKLFGLIGELYVVQRGWKEDYNEEGEPPRGLDYQRTLTYLSLPVMTHIYFGNERIKGFFNIGPSVSYLLSETTKSNFDYFNPYDVPNFPGEYRPTEQLTMPVKNRFDYGLEAGAGMEVWINKKNSIMLEGRFYFGLGGIYPGKKRDVFSASRPMSIEISTAYLFRIK